MNFKGKNILVVGFGISGQAAARFLLSRGAKVEVTDQGVEPVRETLPNDLRKLHGYWNGHPPEIFKGRDLIILSPGVPNDLLGLKLARRKKIPIVGEFGLAAHLLKSPMIAVTGTNGKSTTVTLIDEFLKAAHKKVALGGNIGTPLLEVVMENKRWDWVVAEVSSYQLETLIDPFRPKIAVLLNITEDHLDRYPSLKSYAAAKFQIFKDQRSADFLIYNHDDPLIQKGVRSSRARKIPFSLNEQVASVSGYVLGSSLFFGREEYPLSRVKLIGRHNQENMLAAIAAARMSGVAPGTIQKVLENFPGLPHRTQFVRTHAGVVYYDDSKGTNVDAVVKSLSGFPDRSVILIAGGREKGGSYRPLREMARRKVRQMILIGEAQEQIAGAMTDAVETIKAEKMEKAVPLAAQLARTGDIVLLSPACSSFDQFKNYKERGDLFQRLVRQL